MNQSKKINKTPISKQDVDNIIIIRPIRIMDNDHYCHILPFVNTDIKIFPNLTLGA